MFHLTRRIQRLAVSRFGTTASNFRRSSSDKRASRSSRTLRIAADASSRLAFSSSRTRRAFAVSSHSSAQSPHAGLFSIPELQRPQDFSKLTKKAIQECNQLRNSVAQTVNNNANSNGISSSAHDAIQLLHQLDDISKAVCNVIDAAELCRSVHADPLWREAATQAFAQLSDYIAQLNADTTLYHALQLVTQSPYYTNTNSSTDGLLSEEDKRFAMLLQAEFERDGIHLTEEQREEVRELQNQITQLESSFHHNLLYSEHPFAVKNSAAVTQVIPMQVLQQMGVTIQNSNTEEQQQQPQIILNNNDSQILQTLLKYSPNAALRQEVYREYMTAVPENEIVLQELQRARHQLAVRQGFDSYVKRNLLGKMAASTATVDAFLQTAASENRSDYRRDMEALVRAKEKVDGNSSNSTSIIEPWDTAFYTGLLTAKDGDLAATVAQYLSKEAALNGMQVLVDRLFGIQMVEEEMADAERWDWVPGGGGEPSLPPDDQRLRKFVFTTSDVEGARPLGTMFLDLHPRPGKYGHAAHFTVRCGCALQDWSSASSSQEEEDGSVRYQLPIVALVCNLASSRSEGLSHSEVETLYHEFGHGLHSLLSRTKFQHMSGTRAAMDFVETPSHLIEKFVWDPTFLQTALTSSNPMPDDLVERLRQSRHQFASIERQNQILYAMFDQQLFGVPVPGRSPQDLFAQLHRDHDVPYLPGTHWYTRFGHLVSYGAGYYGYLYSQLFARDLWKTCFAGNSLSRDAGMLLWDKMLRHGGARDPKIMLHDMLGRAPKVDFSV